MVKKEIEILVQCGEIYEVSDLLVEQISDLVSRLLTIWESRQRGRILIFFLSFSSFQKGPRGSNGWSPQPPSETSSQYQRDITPHRGEFRDQNSNSRTDERSSQRND